MASSSSTAEPSGATARPPAPLTPSEILVRDYLVYHPHLGSSALGKVEVMTDRYTNREWAEQIAETQKKVFALVEKAREEGRKYDVPRIGSGEFARTIDHTLLKLDATGSQIDALCSEARTEGFKVSHVNLQETHTTS